MIVFNSVTVDHPVTQRCSCCYRIDSTLLRESRVSSHGSVKDKNFRHGRWAVSDFEKFPSRFKRQDIRHSHIKTWRINHGCANPKADWGGERGESIKLSWEIQYFLFWKVTLNSTYQVFIYVVDKWAFGNRQDMEFQTIRDCAVISSHGVTGPWRQRHCFLLLTLYHSLKAISPQNILDKALPCDTKWSLQVE